MSAGLLLLIISAILVYCGLLQRVLDRMYLTDRQALMVIGLMILGTFLPNVELGLLSVNIGGAIIPLGICIYLIFKADETRILTAAAVCALSFLLPAEAETMPLDPMWVYGILGGTIAWFLGRSRRAAFICGVAGVALADIVSAFVAWGQGYHNQLVLGGGGIADAAVISGVISVLLCELLGETIERIVRAQGKQGGRS